MQIEEGTRGDEVEFVTADGRRTRCEVRFARSSAIGGRAGRLLSRTRLYQSAPICGICG